MRISNPRSFYNVFFIQNPMFFQHFLLSNLHFNQFPLFLGGSTIVNCEISLLTTFWKQIPMGTTPLSILYYLLQRVYFCMCAYNFERIIRLEEKNILQNNLTLFVNSNSLPWMLAGDFNDICNQDEKVEGTLINLTRCFTFNERIIQSANLLTLGSLVPNSCGQG